MEDFKDDRPRTPLKQRKKKVGHYRISSSELFNGRYVSIGKIGDGTFGRVVRVFDRIELIERALKIIKNKDNYRQDAIIEYKILKELNGGSKQHPGSQKIVTVFDAFNQGANFCLVFERLGMSLKDFIKKSITGLPIFAIQKILHDCLMALDYMHSMGYTHTDIKPENILLVESRKPVKYDIKIIDLGGAVSDEEKHTATINTRQYRAPEVILKNIWTKASDMWSLGTVALELYTGHRLFSPDDDDFCHLALIERFAGPIPQNMVNYSKCNAQHFNEYMLEDSYLRYPDSVIVIHKVESQPTLGSLFQSQHQRFRDMLMNWFSIEPRLRQTPREALQHEFFKTVYKIN